MSAEIDPAFAARASYIMQAVDTARPVRILDAGCGRGFYLYAASLFPDIREIHGIDLNAEYISQAKNRMRDDRITIKKASIYHLPYPDGYFDMVIASEILEHLDDDEAGLAEIRRVLKPHGTAVITVPHNHFPFMWDPVNWILMKTLGIHINKDIWWLAGIWADHVRLYSDSQLRDVVRRAKLKITSSRRIIAHCWPFTHFVLYGIGKNLVERAGATTFSRFDTTGEKRLSRFLAVVMTWPSRTFDRPPLTTAMNLLITVKK